MEHSLDLDAIIRTHLVALQWPARHRIVVEQMLRRIVSPVSEHFQSVLFQRFSELFKAGNRAALGLVDALALVENQSFIESQYVEQLLKRSVEGDLELDRLFIARYRGITSPDKTLLMRSILKDHDEGADIVGQCRLPPFLRIAVTSSAFWKPVFLPLLIPDDIRNALASFTEVYHERMPRRRIWWDSTLSSVTLTYSGGSLKCDAIIATLLLTLSRPGVRYTFNSIASELGLKLSVIEAVVRVLKSSKAGQIISVSGSTLSVNDHVSLPSSLAIPASTERTPPAASSKPEMLGFMSEASQIDAAILRILKKGSIANFPQLLANCASLLRFNVAEEAVTGRLKELEARRFVEQDPSGGYKYKI
jgi:hypothetical protein